MIAEDSESILKLYEIILNLNGFKIIGKAQNGQEAIIMYSNFVIKPDIIIMDYRMPIKNGIDASEEILKMDANAKIIFVSADSSVRISAEKIGITHFLSKPFSITSLIEIINQISNHKIINQ